MKLLIDDNLDVYSTKLNERQEIQFRLKTNYTIESNDWILHYSDT